MANQIRIWTGDPNEISQYVNEWLIDYEHDYRIKNIQYQYPDAHYDRASVMVWYEEISYE